MAVGLRQNDAFAPRTTRARVDQGRRAMQPGRKSAPRGKICRADDIFSATPRYRRAHRSPTFRAFLPSEVWPSSCEARGRKFAGRREDYGRLLASVEDDRYRNG